MNDPVIEQIISDSQALLAAAGPAFAAQTKLAELEPRLDATVAELTAVKDNVQKNAELAADFFIGQNMLTLEKRAAFVERLSANPSEIVGAMQTFADAISAREPGQPGTMKTAGDVSVDPIAAFAMS